MRCRRFIRYAGGKKKGVSWVEAVRGEGSHRELHRRAAPLCLLTGGEAWDGKPRAIVIRRLPAIRGYREQSSTA